MKLTLVGAWVVTVLLLGAAMTATASANEPPEWGRCVKVESPKRGVGYTASTCITRAKPTALGKYEWAPAAQPENLRFSGAGGETELKTVGHPTIKCVAANISGEYTGAKTASVTIELQACNNPSSTLCKSPNATATGEILTFPLSAEIGFTRHEEVNGHLVVAVGMDLKPTPPLTALASYECTGEGESAMVEGSVIGKLSPINKMSEATDVAFLVKKTTGLQVPESFQEGPKDTLSTTYANGLETSGPFASTLNIVAETGSNSTPIEIKGLEK